MKVTNILSLYDTTETSDKFINDMPKIIPNIREFIVKLLLLKFKLNCLKYYILVIDAMSFDWLKKIFTKSDIMYAGIIEIYDINATGYKFPLPCIYFVEPTVENLSKIASDMSNKLYTNYNVCFNGNSDHLSQDNAFKNINLKKITLLGDYLTFTVYVDNIILLHNLNNFVDYLMFFKFEPITYFTKKSQYMQSICENVNKQIKVKNPNSVLVMFDRSSDILPLLLYSFTIESLYYELINQRIFTFDAKQNNGEFHSESFDVHNDLLFNKHRHDHFVDVVDQMHKITHLDEMAAKKYEAKLNEKLENEVIEHRKLLRNKEKIENETYIRHYYQYISMIHKLSDICKNQNIRDASLIQQKIVFNEITTLYDIYTSFNKTIFTDKTKIRILVLFFLKYPKYIKQIDPKIISSDIITKTQQIVMNITNKFGDNIFDTKYIESLTINNNNYDTSLYVPKICKTIENGLINVYDSMEPFDVINTYEFRKNKSKHYHKKNQTLIIYVNDFITHFELNTIQSMMKNKYPHINIVVVSDSIKNYNDLF